MSWYDDLLNSTRQKLGGYGDALQDTAATLGNGLLGAAESAGALADMALGGGNLARGGDAGGSGEDPGVAVVVAGGEYVIHPDHVRQLAEGDLDEGHSALDHFVTKMRARTVKTLKNLPGPKRD